MRLPGLDACGAGRSAAIGMVAAFFIAAPAVAAEVVDTAQQANELSNLSLDELAQIRVTSVSKRPEGLNTAASSVYVITPDAVRNVGAQTLPEALRLAPNLEVMRIDALDYSITARGFAGFESANKLLVLMDGRSLYTPLFSGVDWDQHHLVLDDLDRIEVISGPAGTLWGANAVNGVVSVTTRSAFETRGLLAAGSVGTLDSDVRVRAGGSLGAHGAGRIYATAFSRGDLDRADGSSANDGWEGWQTGFRTDWLLGAHTLTLQGDLQDADIDQSLGFGAGYVRGGNVLGRWRAPVLGGAFELQGYYDQIERQARGIHDELRVWSVDAQHAFDLGRHAVVVGAGYRITKDEFRTVTEPQLLSPPRRQVDIGNVFLQDHVALTDALDLTLGVKLETNDYTKAEWMPSARLGWRISDRQFVWAAASRAIRNPSRIERDFTIAGLVEPGLMGSEKLIAYEAGYRGRFTEAATLSVTAYLHDYDELRTNEFVPGRNPPIFVGNTMEGRTWGIEAWTEAELTPWWRLNLGGSILRKDFDLKPGSLDVAAFEAAGADPSYWLKAGSTFRLAEAVDLTVTGRLYDDAPRLGASGYVGVDAYAEANVRLAWRVSDRVELAVVGRDLLHERHAEATEQRRSEVPRSVYLSVRWTR
ncbi:TonB-dependent receptor plug domain-containing protein [Phenylobacterium deserti]|uniref:TonB-dependent receptor n=1 Tax=Phenylobacterium deserti TaxID=1914756 RepID=A0A328AA18_9CAUL|nr:TonB-dependent receptor [Phenylobacterium deserti]RAK51563.1 TonB-dependent receptor [Phenylobacterium deserti]